jgi:DNA-binding CsgD family transcriptional regulator
MSEKMKMKISPAVAAYVRPGTPVETRLAGCGAAAGLPPFERITLLFCLSKDPESTVKSSAIEELKLLPQDVVRVYAYSVDAHPLVLEMFSKIGFASKSAIEIPNDSTGPTDPTDQSDEPDQIDESNEEFLSKYKMAQVMGIGEKIKMALTGDKEWRALLVKDANKLVSGGVIKNPRITESEVLAMVKAGIQNDEIVRLICANREWVKNYNLRKALISNSRTPIQNAMRYLDTMGEKDLAAFAKSKNISSVLSTMAKRVLLTKKK